MDIEKIDGAANRLADFYKSKLSPKQIWNIQNTEAGLVEQYIPDAAIAACVTLDGNDAPSKIVALHDLRLYVLSVAAPNENDAVIGEPRMIRIDPDAGTVRLETSHSQIDPEHRRLVKPSCEATWRFTLEDGFRLTLTAKRDNDGRVTGAQECELAQALAEALGWQFPGESAPDADAG